MGVSGLMMYCKERRDEVTDRVDLLHVVRQLRHGSPIEILVDFYAFESFILPAFLKQEVDISGNELVRLFGGEYSAYDSFVFKFLVSLIDVGIRFVFFIDSSRGSSPDIRAHKLETWKQRFHETLDFFQEIGEVCRGKRKIHQLRDKVVRPCLLTVQTLESIFKAGCEIIPCLYAEADSFIGHQLHRRPQAFAVFSHDSDFIVMRECRLIPIEWFDVNGDFASFLNGKKKAVHSLVVDIVTPEKVGFSLGLPSPDRLVDVAILKGNDFTRPFLKDMNLRGHLSLRNFSIQSFASWVSRIRSIDDCDYLWQAMRRDADFRSAVLHSRQFYSLTLPIERPESKDPFLTSLVEEGISSGKYPVIFLAMHHGFYWQREIVSDVTPGSPNVEVALTSLRESLYDLIVADEKRVLEFSRGADNQLLDHYASRRNEFPNLKDVASMNEEQRLDLFARIFSDRRPSRRNRAALTGFSMVPSSPESTASEIFLIVFVRYFVSCGRSDEFGLRLERWELDALAASMFDSISSTKVEIERKIVSSLIPSIRCLTLFNWLQEIYLYAYNLFGKALQLSHLFPSPAQLFCGSVYVHFYMGSKSNSHLYSSWNELRNQILRQNDTLYRCMISN